MNFKKAHVAAFKAHKAAPTLHNQYSYYSSVWNNGSGNNSLKTHVEVGLNDADKKKKRGQTHDI